MEIRMERPQDIAAVHHLHRLAFETGTEANLVDALREQAQPVVSIVADEDAAIVGHVLFSPVTLPSRRGLRIMGLGPMAVLPARQRQGIGSALVRAGLEECRQTGAAAVVVLGHAAYYPRFGFVPASRFGIASGHDVPDDVFMALELEDRGLAGPGGTIRYPPAFAAV